MIETNPQHCSLQVDGIEVQVIRKAIKNLHLAVYPPEGWVRIAVPEHVTDDSVRLAVVAKLSWIKRQQKAFAQQARQSTRRYISGECHYFLGKRYRLALIEQTGKHRIEWLKSGKIKMFASPGMSIPHKDKLMQAWYRTQLKDTVSDLLIKWEPLIGKSVKAWHIRKMKTKWGSCNREHNRILLNLELAKKPLPCIEYILVHEMMHLHERHHNDRFRQLMDQYLPAWRTHRQILNHEPLMEESFQPKPLH